MSYDAYMSFKFNYPNSGIYVHYTDRSRLLHGKRGVFYRGSFFYTSLAELLVRGPK